MIRHCHAPIIAVVMVHVNVVNASVTMAGQEMRTVTAVTMPSVWIASVQVMAHASVVCVFEISGYYR